MSILTCFYIRLSKRVLRRPIFFVVALLISALIPPGVNLKSAFAKDCTGACRAAYQWQGGSVGNIANIMVEQYDRCRVGCTQIWTGTWSKNTDSSRYIFVGYELTETQLNYFYGIWRPTGFEWRTLGAVPAGDQSQYADFTVTVSGNAVHAMVNSPNWYNDVATSMEDRIFWQLLVGYRIWAADNDSVDFYSFESRWHMWQCGCDLTWHYQTNDPIPTSDSTNTRMVQWWPTPVHLSSTGGSYSGYCGTGSGDQQYCP